MSAIPPDFWTAFASPGTNGGDWRVRAPLPETCPRLLGGVGGAGGRKWIIELAAGDTGMADRKSRGVSVATVELADDQGGRRRHIVIECAEPTGHAWFDLLGADLAGMLASQAPAPAVTRTLAKWRRFWGQPPSELLKREEQIGLFAELWFLWRWLLPAVGPLASANRWRGPFGARRDFEWMGGAVEVKGCTMVRAPVFRIHGLDQLDPPGGNGALWFFALRLREDGGGDHTLPGIVRACEDGLADDPEASGLFETALTTVGYSPLHEADYAGTRWRVVDERLYPVGEGFPRLGSEDFPYGLPTGVSELSYALDLSGYTGPCIRNAAEASQIFGTG